MPDSEKPRTWGVWTGRELKTIQLWRSPEGVVVLRNPEGLRQIEFTAAQWRHVTEHVAEPRCTCEEISGDPLCPIHDQDLIADGRAR